MDLTALRSFVTVVELGSFSAAAAKLVYSRSTLSEHIAALERSVGARLFDRNGVTTQLTPPGRALLPLARMMLVAAEEARLAVLGAAAPAAAPSRSQCGHAAPRQVATQRDWHLPERRQP